MQIDREQWEMEYQQVAPKLQIRVAAEARDWRTHLEAALQDKESLVKLWPDSQTALKHVQQGILKQLAKVDNRENYLNNEFASRTDEFRNKKEVFIQKQVRIRVHTCISELCAPEKTSDHWTCSVGSVDFTKRAQHTGSKEVCGCTIQTLQSLAHKRRNTRTLVGLPQRGNGQDPKRKCTHSRHAGALPHHLKYNRNRQHRSA
jgi:hypothetical protein